MQQEPKCGCSQSSFTLKGARTGFSKNQKTERHEIAEFVIQHFHWVIAYQHVFYIHAASSTSTRSTQSVRLIGKRFHCRLLFISRRALNGHNWNQLRAVCTFHSARDLIICLLKVQLQALLKIILLGKLALLKVRCDLVSFALSVCQRRERKILREFPASERKTFVKFLKFLHLVMIADGDALWLLFPIITYWAASDPPVKCQPNAMTRAENLNASRTIAERQAAFISRKSKTVCEMKFLFRRFQSRRWFGFDVLAARG